MTAQMSEEGNKARGSWLSTQRLSV